MPSWVRPDQPRVCAGQPIELLVGGEHDALQGEDLFLRETWLLLVTSHRAQCVFGDQRRAAFGGFMKTRRGS